MVYGEVVIVVVEYVSWVFFGWGELVCLDEVILVVVLWEIMVVEFKLGSFDGIVDLLVVSGLLVSKGVVWCMIYEGGVLVNNIWVDNEEWVL